MIHLPPPRGTKHAKAPVDTQIIEAAAGKPRQQLPDTQLRVMARLTAQSAEDLDLRQCEPCQGDGHRRAA